MSDKIHLDDIGDIRESILDGMGMTLKSLGFSDAVISKAKAESLEKNSDEPMMKLVQKSPIFQFFAQP